jgi:hypothetical protein
MYLRMLKALTSEPTKIRPKVKRLRADAFGAHSTE